MCVGSPSPPARGGDDTIGSGTSERPDAARVRPLPEIGRSRAWLAVVASGVVGVVVLGTVYELLAGRLPAQIPSHYSGNGTPDGYSAPAPFVVVGIGTEAFLTALFAGLTAVLGSSTLLRHQYRGRLGPLLGTLGCAVSTIVPVAWCAILLQAVGRWPSALPVYLLALVPVAGIIVLSVVLALRFRSPIWYPPFWRSGRGAPDTSAGDDDHGVLVFRCSACGQTFHRPAIYLLGPRVVRSYYSKCPRCGERGWNLLETTEPLGTAGRPGGMSSRPLRPG